MKIKRRTMHKMWAVLSIFVMTFAVMTAGAGAFPVVKSFWAWAKFW